ncbi:transforming growth factor beta activator LRRC32-like, partial [Lampetra planeri]
KPSLDRLKMTGNALTRLTHNLFKDNKGLRAVTIDDNLISVINPGTFEPLSQLETLNLAKNNLAHICDFNLHQVKHLNLSMNSVEFFVTHEDDHMYNLEILDLSYNKLLYFPIVPKRNHLKYLYLQYNMLGTLMSEVTMVTEANALYNEIVNKGDVRVGMNELHSNWRQMPLSYIDLSYNHFRLFPLETLSLISSLEILNFSHNCVQNITWNVRNSSESGYHRRLFFPSLKYLNLESNGLVSVSPLVLNMLTQIETLNLQDNSVQPCAPMDDFQDSTQQMNHNASCVVFGKLRSLKHLSLRENNMKILHVNSFHKTSLVSLNLARNPQMVMQAGALEGVQRTLQSLTISEISMTNSGLSLPCMPQLTHLNMSDNKLNILPSSLGCSPLREISIRNNTFLSLNYSLILALSVHLDVMYISENYFNCCDSRWLMVLNEQKIRLPDISQTQCFDGVNKIHIEEYLRTSSLYCVFTEAQNIHFAQIIILILFVSVIIAVFIMLIRKMCCTHT